MPTDAQLVAAADSFVFGTRAHGARVLTIDPRAFKGWCLRVWRGDEYRIVEGGRTREEAIAEAWAWVSS